MCTPDADSVDIDLADRRPLRLGIDDGRHVWLASPGEVTRVCAADLRQLARRVARVREEQAGRDVVADISVVVADDARAALAALAELGQSPPDDTLVYVGTAIGLAGLVADLYALGITDGAMLVPLPGQGSADLLRTRVVCQLQTLLPGALDSESRTA